MSWLVIMMIKRWQTLFGEYCIIHSMLYSVYTVLADHSGIWHWDIERDNWTLWSVMMVEQWMGMRDGGWKYILERGFERIWEIRGTMSVIGFSRSGIGVITSMISSLPWSIRNCTLTCIGSFLVFQGLMIISHPLKSCFFLSSTLQSLQTTKLINPSRDFHDFSIRSTWMQHIPSTGYTEYCFPQELSIASTAFPHHPLSPTLSQYIICHLLWDLVVYNTVHFHNVELQNELSLSSCHAYLLSNHL